MPKTKTKKDFNASAKAKAGSTKGKSLGTFVSTAYGPPWTGIQGTGVTSQGTKLPSSPGPQGDLYLIAGDPTVLKYGSWYHISPNPLNTNHPFKMDDTGGPEFHGGSKRIDFLVMAGRAKQLAWGRKPVTITQASGPNDSKGTSSSSESAGTTKSTTVRVPYKFKVGANESYWDSIIRLSDEVNFCAFMRDGQFWYTSERFLAAQALAASITPKSPYLIGRPTFDIDLGKPANECQLSILAGRYDLPPGAAVRLTGFGPADGVWIVSEVSRELTSDLVSVSLKTPEDTISEPSPEVKTVTTSTGTSADEDGGSAASSGGKVGYPLSTKGKLIGVPGQGTHSFTAPPNNWQSDNALDIGVPNGTRVYAVEDGVVTRAAGSYSGGSGRFDGLTVTIKTKSGEWFYTHMSARNPSIKAGAKVKRGQQLGRSGSANGVPHLHIGSTNKNIKSLLGW